MLTTAGGSRPLLCSAVLTLLTFGLPAAEAQGADPCPGATDIPQTPQQVSAAAGAVTCLVNAERTSRGIPALRRDADLAQAARAHAEDMAQHDYFAHTSPDGVRLGDRLRAAGYGRPGEGWRAGEDIGWGTGDRATPSALVDAWLNSDGHRRILLSATYEEIGVGVAAGAPRQTSSGLPGATYTMDVGTIRRP
jgi:uncharacterized protein YkwD